MPTDVENAIEALEKWSKILTEINAGVTEGMKLVESAGPLSDDQFRIIKDMNLSLKFSQINGVLTQIEKQEKIVKSDISASPDQKKVAKSLHDTAKALYSGCYTKIQQSATFRQGIDKYVEILDLLKTSPLEFDPVIHKKITTIMTDLEKDVHTADVCKGLEPDVVAVKQFHTHLTKMSQDLKGNLAKCLKAVNDVRVNQGLDKMKPIAPSDPGARLTTQHPPDLMHAALRLKTSDVDMVALFKGGAFQIQVDALMSPRNNGSQTARTESNPKKEDSRKSSTLARHKEAYAEVSSAKAKSGSPPPVATDTHSPK